MNIDWANDTNVVIIFVCIILIIILIVWDIVDRIKRRRQ